MLLQGRIACCAWSVNSLLLRGFVAGTFRLMLTLINTNRMMPPIAPIGLEYVAEAAVRAGIEVTVLDLGLRQDPAKAIREHFRSRNLSLIGLSFRNVDDCFWPSAEWFVPGLAKLVQDLRTVCDAPIVVGGVGFSVFAPQVVEYTGVDFGIRGDGEASTISLYQQLHNDRNFAEVPGLLWRQGERIVVNEPAWPADLSLSIRRTMVDNRTYFARGGQIGFETKRGCNRLCLYCADPLSKGSVPRSRKPEEIADEIESLLSQGIDVLHTCDAEFNVPRSHAMAVCEELNRRSLGERVRWYTYLAVTPFDAEMAAAMRKAGCVGINFTGDSANERMLRTYRQPHRSEDLADAVRLCRENGIKVMIDLLLGGPGETPQTAAETIDFIKRIDPDCAGTSMGIRIYPGTGMVDAVQAEGPLETNPGLRRKYGGPVDFFRPTFYLSPALGPDPARLVKDLIAGDQRFFEPMTEQPDAQATDHNYNNNTQLADAIAAGARGAYWDILHKLRIQNLPSSSCCVADGLL
ncbi:MAG TPA: radical SAM protein [Sedimentisphaerales bacterium]|nr:radical SAM protein [Sedimentisphaerales bacterium]